MAPDESKTELERQRQEIARGLSLINTFNLAVVALVAGLALVASLLGLRAREDAESLWSASSTQARAQRLGGESGWKSNALATIKAASQVRASLALRNEAISALASVDLEPLGRWHPQSTRDNALAFSADLKRVAIGDFDGNIRLLDMATERELKRFTGPAFVESLTFSEDGRHLAGRFYGGDVAVYDVDSGREKFLVPGKDPPIKTIAFVGNEVWIGAHGELHVYDLGSGSRSRSFTVDAWTRGFVAVADVGRWASHHRDKVQIRDIKSGDLISEFTCPAEVGSVALSASGTRLAAGCGNGEVILWDLQQNQSRTLSGHKLFVFHVAFSPDGSKLVSGAFGGTARLWESSSGMLLMGTESQFLLHFSSNGDQIAATRTKAGYGVFQIGDAGVTRTIALPSRQAASAGRFEFLDDATALVARESEALILDFNAGAVLAEVPVRRGRHAVFQAESNVMITSGRDGLLAWSLPTNRAALAEWTFPNPTKILIKQGVPDEGVKLGANGREALTRIGMRGAVLFDLEANTTLAVFNVPNIGDFDLSPDGRWIATGTFHGEGTKIWDRTGAVVKEIGGRDAGVRFSANGRWLVTAASDAIEIYETANWTRAHRIEVASASGLPGPVAVSPDSDLIAFAKQRRGVQLIDAARGIELASLEGPTAVEVASITFTPAGDQLLIGTMDGLLRSWDLGKLRAELRRLDLDWSQDAMLARPGTGNTMLVVASLAGLTLALVFVFSFLAWKRHRQFLHAYRGIEQMMEERNRQLAAAQQELHQSEKMRALGTLAAGICHDFNNLLSIVRLSNQLTAEQTRGNADIQENATLIERAVGQGKQVVKSMLGYSRTPGSREPYPVTEAVDAILRLLRPEFLQNVQLHTIFEDALPPVHGVRNRLEQILLNLIVNAAEAMGGRGRLDVHVRLANGGATYALRPAPSEKYIEVSITDSGPGIAPSVQTRIFEPFFTTKSVGTQRGTGLGLSIVYSVAQEEGIGLAMESGPAGTHFRVFLPTSLRTTDVRGDQPFAMVRP